MRTKVAEPSLNVRIARVAERQYGLVTRAQLLELGLGPSGISHRLVSRRIRSLHRGVYSTGSGPVEGHARLLAAVLALGEGAVLSHRSAAHLWDLRRQSRGPLEVTVPIWSGRARRSGISIHRCRLPAEDVTSVEGITVTSLARTLIDVAEVLPAGQLRRAIAEAEYLRLFDLRALEASLARNPNRVGGRRLSNVLADAVEPDITRSELEERFLELCELHPLPCPAVNAHVEGFEVDFLWREARLIVEVDGYAAHGTRARFERARDVELNAAGYTVLRFTYRQVSQRGAWVAGRVGAALEVRSG